MARTEPFERFASRYERWFQRHPSAYQSELAAIRALLPRGIAGRGLEIGVGTGRFAAALGLGYGVEPAEAMRKLAQERGLCVAAGVSEALPFRGASFALALMVTTVCFVDDLDASLQEARRVLAPGGIFMVGLVDRDSPLGERYQRQRAENVFYREATFYRPREIESAMERAGFHRFAFCQTLFRPLEEIRSPEPIREGHGTGSFVAIRGEL
jgi:SAM-dependent methyltransferase